MGRGIRNEFSYLQFTKSQCSATRTSFANEIEYWSYTPSELAGHEGASVAKKFRKLFCLERLEPFAKHCQRFTDKVKSKLSKL